MPKLRLLLPALLLALRCNVAAQTNFFTVPPAHVDIAQPLITFADLADWADSESVAAPAVEPTPAAHAASSEVKPTSITYSGFVDAYYTFNFQHPANATTAFRAFDVTSGTPELNFVKLMAERTVNPVTRFGFRIATAYGSTMNAVNSPVAGGSSVTRYVEEAYLSYYAPVGKGLQADVGKFVTPMGAEVIETQDNWNYSRGLLFSYAIPYYHFGIRMSYTFNSKYSLSTYAVNGWNTVVDNNHGKSYGASFAWTPNSKINVTETFMAGPELQGAHTGVRKVSDTVLKVNATSRLSLLMNFDDGGGDLPPGAIKPARWFGIANGARFAWSNYAVAGRYEWFSDPSGFTTGTAQDLHEATITLERRLGGHLLSRLEYRHDGSDAATFLQGGVPTTGQSTLQLGLIASFHRGQ